MAPQLSTRYVFSLAIKVGVPIGTATQAIAPGEHVHSHNLQSDHIPIELKEEDD